MKERSYAAGLTRVASKSPCDLAGYAGLQREKASKPVCLISPHRAPEPTGPAKASALRLPSEPTNLGGREAKVRIHRDTWLKAGAATNLQYEDLALAHKGSQPVSFRSDREGPTPRHNFFVLHARQGVFLTKRHTISVYRPGPAPNSNRRHKRRTTRFANFRETAA